MVGDVWWDDMMKWAVIVLHIDEGCTILDDQVTVLVSDYGSKGEGIVVYWPLKYLEAEEGFWKIA